MAWAVVLCAAVLALGGSAGADERNPRLLGYVVVPDLPATLGQVETLAAMFSPEALPPGALATTLGQRVGDPELAGLGRGPLVLMVLAAPAPMAGPGIALFAPVTNQAPYENALAALGWQSRTAGGLLMAASTPDVMAGAPALMAEYRSIEGAHVGGDARVALHAARLMDAYGPLLTSGVEALRSKLSGPAAGPAAPPAGAARILALEAASFLLVLRQVEQVRWDLDLQPDAVATDTLVTARPGTALDVFARQAPPGPPTAAAFLSGPAIMTAVYHLDAARLREFVNALAREAAADPVLAPLFTADLLAVLDQASRVYTGEVAVRMVNTAAVPMGTETVMGVSDPAQALALVEKGAALLGSSGPLQALSAESGLAMTSSVRRDVRRHAGVPIHRFQISVAGKPPLGEQEKALQAMLQRGTEFAITGGYYVGSQDPVGLDALIDRVRAGRSAPGPVLQSMRAFGEGRHAYVDYDFLAAVRALADMMPAARDKPNPFALLPAGESEPFLSAVSFTDGQLRIESRMPLRPFARMAEAARQKTAPPRAKE